MRQTLLDAWFPPLADYLRSSNEFVGALKALSLVLIPFLICKAIAEIYKYFKDAYYFGTWNWNRQWKCREAMNCYYGVHNARLYNWRMNQEQLKSVETAMRMAMPLMHTYERKDAFDKPIKKDPKKYDEEWKDLIDYINKEKLVSYINIYERRNENRKGIFRGYGHVY